MVRLRAGPPLLLSGMLVWGRGLPCAQMGYTKATRQAICRSLRLAGLGVANLQEAEGCLQCPMPDPPMRLEACQLFHENMRTCLHAPGHAASSPCMHQTATAKQSSRLESFSRLSPCLHVIDPKCAL